MPTRRNTLKTLAGATVVGSLSGCVQLATQETAHFRGTPAMISLERPYQGMDDFFALGVGVEAHRTVERAGITRELVAHSWGMLYSFVSITNTESSNQLLSVMKARSNIATFTTPSIQIAGQELNPITNLTVGDIVKEFLSITELESNVPRVVAAETERSIHYAAVNDATGRNVLRAFRDAVGAPSTEYQPPDLDASASGGTLSTVPDWDGDRYEFDIAGADLQAANDDGSVPGYSGLNPSIAFDKLDGDFMVTFQSLPTGKTIDSQHIVHPPDDKFSRAVIHGHLITANLRGAQGLAEQGQQLLDGTRELLQHVQPLEEQRQREKFHRVVTDTQDALERLESIMGGLGEDLQSIEVTSSSGSVAGLSTAWEQSTRAADIARRAHERVASHNDTRDEEDDRFVQIERRLADLRWVSRTIERAIANGRKTVKARDV